MTQIQTIRLVDDLTGDPADETVHFALDGEEFMIDLSTSNAAKLRQILGPYMSAARVPISVASSYPYDHDRRNTPTRSTVRAHNRAVREWARENGHYIADRGRLPQAIVDAHRAAARRSAAGH